MNGKAALTSQTVTIKAGTDAATSCIPADVGSSSLLSKKEKWTFSMDNVRKLAIVGDVHCAREQWPEHEEDWRKLWNIDSQPIRLSKVSYSVNQSQKCFDAISLTLRDQHFDSYDMSATDNHKRFVCQIR